MAANTTRLLSVNEYRKGETRRKAWELNATQSALEAAGVVREDAVILGVGVGKEPTIFHLSARGVNVIATDLYKDAGPWAAHAPAEMLTTPGKYAPKGWDAHDRLSVLHMDARNLDLPDASVDAVFSCSSLEHFGSWDDIARAAREIGRVLKPGGVASITTEFMLSGEGDGWNGVRLFDTARLDEYLIKPSGLTLDGALTFRADADTLATAWPLESIVIRNQWPAVEGVLTDHGFTFTSVHVLLTKPAHNGGLIDEAATLIASDGPGPEMIEPLDENGEPEIEERESKPVRRNPRRKTREG
jgi:SAM-dependent methyltransferase